MVLAMADNTRETLLNRVKEQGDLVRQLKAAKGDCTQVRHARRFFFLPPFLATIATSRLDLGSHVCTRCPLSLSFVSPASLIVTNRVPFTFTRQRSKVTLREYAFHVITILRERRLRFTRPYDSDLHGFSRSILPSCCYHQVCWFQLCF